MTNQRLNSVRHLLFYLRGTSIFPLLVQRKKMWNNFSNWTSSVSFFEALIHLQQHQLFLPLGVLFRKTMQWSAQRKKFSVLCSARLAVTELSALSCLNQNAARGSPHKNPGACNKNVFLTKKMYKEGAQPTIRHSGYMSVQLFLILPVLLYECMLPTLFSCKKMASLYKLCGSGYCFC